MDEQHFNSNQIFEKYISEVGKIPELSEEEEKQLFKRVEKGDNEAKEKIAKSYLKLVVNIAKILHKNVPYISILDLISEGNIGLLKAIEKYDIKKGIKFSTYAAWWIKQRIKRALSTSSNIIKIPSHVDDILRCFFKALNANKCISNVEKVEAAKEVGVEIDKINECLEKVKGTLSLNNYDENNSCLEEIIGDSKSETPLSIYEKRELFENLINWLGVLTEKEKKVIVLRYGLGDEIPMTLEQIGKILNLTRERIRQIEVNAINKLRFYLLKIKPDFLD